MKSFVNKSQLLSRPGSSSKLMPSLKRRMSVRGAIKKTRSINVDCTYSTRCFTLEKLLFYVISFTADTLGMETMNVERKCSVIGNLLDVENPNKTRSPSPDDGRFSRQTRPNYVPPERKQEAMNLVNNNNVPTISVGRHRNISEGQSYADTEVEELFAMLRDSESLEEQGDILQYLVDAKGPDFNTGMIENGKVVTVKDLLKGLYEKACQQKLWGLVRHSAGMLGKRVEDLAKAVTDLLVRQKQVRLRFFFYVFYSSVSQCFFFVLFFYLLTLKNYFYSRKKL